MALLGDARHHWRDPMQFLFFAVGVVGRSAMLFMRVAGVAFVFLGICASSRAFICPHDMLKSGTH